MLMNANNRVKLLDVGTRIKLARQAAGLTQSELTAATGLANGVISHIEIGLGAPNLRSLARIAEELHVSINWLVYGNHPPKADRELMAKLVAYERKMED